MVRRQSKKTTNLWIKYPDYTPINNIAELPLLDEARIGDEHQVLLEIIRSDWSLVHPLARDYILSCATEWRRQLTEINSLQSNLETKQNSLDNFQVDYDKKTQRLLLEKDAEIERIKEEVAESFRQNIEEKDHAIARHKMLADSVGSSYNGSSATQDSIIKDLDERDQKIMEFGKLITDLQDKCKSQEIEAMNVQTGISKNFQLQISEITNELYERQEQIEKLRDVLGKAKRQLIFLKGKNDELKEQNDQLEKQTEAREQKLKRVLDTIENLD
ncbi:MAG: hypothetical protein ACTSSH_04395 [Candidatus Heimdallarchaeota archaeon]